MSHFFSLVVLVAPVASSAFYRCPRTGSALSVASTAERLAAGFVSVSHLRNLIYVYHSRLIKFCSHVANLCYLRNLREFVLFVNFFHAAKIQQKLVFSKSARETSWLANYQNESTPSNSHYQNVTTPCLPYYQNVTSSLPPKIFLLKCTFLYFSFVSLLHCYTATLFHRFFTPSSPRNLITFLPFCFLHLHISAKITIFAVKTGFSPIVSLKTLKVMDDFELSELIISFVVGAVLLLLECAFWIWLFIELVVPYLTVD